MQNFGVGSAILTSLISMLIVFFVLIVLASFLTLFRHLHLASPKQSESIQRVRSNGNTRPSQSIPKKVEEERELRMIAMLTASCVAQEENPGDVRIISCRAWDEERKSFS